MKSLLVVLGLSLFLNSAQAVDFYCTESTSSKLRDAKGCTKTESTMNLFEEKVKKAIEEAFMSIESVTNLSLVYSGSVLTSLSEVQFTTDDGEKGSCDVDGFWSYEMTCSLISSGVVTEVIEAIEL